MIWILGWLLQKSVYLRGSRLPVGWPFQIVVSCIGFATLLIWYSLPAH